MATQLTAAQARVIDPVLTEVARGYLSPDSPVANILFPTVEVGQRGGRTIRFSADDYKIANSVRAFGANTKRVQFGYASDPFALVDFRLEGSVPVELMDEADVEPGIDLLAGAVRMVRNMQAREKEKQAADLATNPANFAASNKLALSGTSRWDNTASDPFTDIINAKEAVRGQIGGRPDTLVLGPKVLTALRTHPKVLDRLSTAADRPPATLAQLAMLFELDRIVEGSMTYYDGTAFADVWGKNALLAYTRLATAAEMGSPALGYTYQLRGYPRAEEPYLGRNENTWYAPVADARQPVLVGPAAGFLFSTVVA